MTSIVVYSILITLAAAGLYSFDFFNIKSKINKKMTKGKYKFHSLIRNDTFEILKKEDEIVFSFKLSTLESIVLIKKDAYAYDTIVVCLTNKGLTPVTFSEDEIDLMELYEKLKIFLGVETLIIDAMDILENDTVVLWRSSDSVT